MASKYQTETGWRIQFKVGRERYGIRTGPISERDADRFMAKVESLVKAKRFGHDPSDETLTWLAGLSADVRAKLETAKLIDARKQERPTLGEYIASFRASRAAWSAGTFAQFDLAADDAKTFLKAETRIDTITPADADNFREHLVGRLALATARKRIRLIKTMFKHAVRAKLISENPFADQVTNTPPNAERMMFIDREAAMKVADELTGESKLIFLLARFAGFRVLSEVQALKWEAVDFESETIRVYAPKTKRTRTIPMLPIIRDALTEQLGRVPDGAIHVLEHKHKLPVVRRSVERAIVRASVKPWPKVFQQLRASFATDCVRVLPANTAAQMLGHSAKVAQAFYWTCDSSDVQKARELLAVQSVQNWRTHGGAGERAETRNAEKQGIKAHASAGESESLGAVGFEPT